MNRAPAICSIPFRVGDLNDGGSLIIQLLEHFHDFLTLGGFKFPVGKLSHGACTKMQNFIDSLQDPKLEAWSLLGVGVCGFAALGYLAETASLSKRSKFISRTQYLY